jgi:regulatory protein
VKRPKPDSITPSPALAGEGRGEGSAPSPAFAGEGGGEGSPPSPPDAGELRSARTAALALLAGRDFSRHELIGRLRRKGHGAQVAVAVVDGLVSEGLLRESRYAEQFVTRHVGRGHGPRRIRLEMREKGVDGEAIDQALKGAEADWVAAAREARRRKFGPSPPGDHRERAKQARFLQYRGFSSEQIRAALGPDEDDPDHDDHDQS